MDDPTAVRISGSGSGTYLSVDYLQLSPYVQIVQPQFVSLTDTDNAYLVSITVLVLNPKDIGAESIGLLNSSAVTLVNDTLAIVTVNHTQEKILLDRYVYVNDNGEPYSYLHMYSDDANNVTIEAFQALLMQVVYSDIAVEIDNSTHHVTMMVPL